MYHNSFTIYHCILWNYILNVHHDTGENGWLKASSTNLDNKKAILKSIWEQVSERFGSYGDRLLFEGFNEILDDNSEWVNPSQEDYVDLCDEERNQVLAAAYKQYMLNRVKEAVKVSLEAYRVDNKPWEWVCRRKHLNRLLQK